MSMVCRLSCGSCNVYVVTMTIDDVTERVVYVPRRYPWTWDLRYSLLRKLWVIRMDASERMTTLCSLLSLLYRKPPAQSQSDVAMPLWRHLIVVYIRCLQSSCLQSRHFAEIWNETQNGDSSASILVGSRQWRWPQPQLRRRQLSIDNRLAANQLDVAAAVDRRDRQTDGRTDTRPLHV